MTDYPITHADCQVERLPFTINAPGGRATVSAAERTGGLRLALHVEGVPHLSADDADLLAEALTLGAAELRARTPSRPS